jgi:hypothetical protein
MVDDVVVAVTVVADDVTLLTLIVIVEDIDRLPSPLTNTQKIGFSQKIFLS